jgi:hypothetical protein
MLEKLWGLHPGVPMQQGGGWQASAWQEEGVSFSFWECGVLVRFASAQPTTPPGTPAMAATS